MYKLNKKIIYGSFLAYNILNASSIGSDNYSDPTASSSDKACSVDEKIKNQEKKIKYLNQKNDAILSSIVFCIRQELPNTNSNFSYSELILNLSNHQEKEINRIIASPDIPSRLKELIDKYRANLQEYRANLEEIKNLNKLQLTFPISPEWSKDRDDDSKLTEDEARQLIEYYKKCIDFFNNIIEKFLKNIISDIEQPINLNFPGIKKLKNGLINCSDEEKKKKIIEIITHRNFNSDKRNFLPTRVSEMIYDYKTSLEHRSRYQEKFKKLYFALKKSRKKTAKNPINIAIESLFDAELLPTSIKKCTKEEDRWSNGGRTFFDKDYRKLIEEYKSIESKDLLIENISLIFKDRIKYYFTEKIASIDDIISALKKLDSTTNHINDSDDIKKLKNALTGCSDTKEKRQKIMEIIDDPNFKSDRPGFPADLINKYKICIEQISCLHDSLSNIENLLLNRLSLIIENIASDDLMFSILKEALIEDKAINRFFKTPKVLEFIFIPGNMNIYYSMLGIMDEDPDDSRVVQHILDLSIKNIPLSNFVKYIDRYIEVAYSTKKDSYTSEDFKALDLLI